jgi:esterase
MVARGLAPHFSVYSLDLPNHGQSPRTKTMSYQDMATVVAEFIDSKNLGPCYLLGHSMGGKVAMQMALQRPDCVAKLVVADIAPVQYPPHHDNVLAGLDAVTEANPANRREADAVLAEFVEEAGVRAFLLKSWQRDKSGGYHWLVNREAIRANYPKLGEANHGEGFSGPTLFIKGSESDYVLADHRAAIAALFPNAQLKVIQGTGHWLHAEKPALFNKLVLRFLLG